MLVKCHVICVRDIEQVHVDTVLRGRGLLLKARTKLTNETTAILQIWQTCHKTRKRFHKIKRDYSQVFTVLEGNMSGNKHTPAKVTQIDQNIPFLLLSIG